MVAGRSLTRDVILLLLWRYDGYEFERYSRSGFAADRTLSRFRRMMFGEYRIRPHPSPEVSTFPKVITGLDPSAVIADENGSIIVALAGGLDHFGVIVYPEKSKGRLVMGGIIEEKELLPGLWYYDDGYREMGSEWEQRLGALRPKKQPQVNSGGTALDEAVGCAAPGTCLPLTSGMWHSAFLRK